MEAPGDRSPDELRTLDDRALVFSRARRYAESSSGWPISATKFRACAPHNGGQLPSV
jgi:hypothetical protein